MRLRVDGQESLASIFGGWKCIRYTRPMESEEQRGRIVRKLSVYQPSVETATIVRTTPKLFLVGISGAGKDTIMHELLKTRQYYPIVSHTTRQPRVNNGKLEREGVEYHFINLAQAERMLDKGAYVEAALYGDNVYGTSAAAIRAAHDSGKVAITDIEVHGMTVYRVLDPHTRAVFVVPPSYQVWQERLLKRYGGAVDADDYTKRMVRARAELTHALGVPHFLFIINDHLEQTVREVTRIAHGGTVSLGEEQVAHAIARDILREIAAQGFGGIGESTTTIG